MLTSSKGNQTNVVVKVLQIVDGATIVVDLEGKEQTIKYAMVEPPNKSDKASSDHSKRYNETLINQSNGNVQLILDAAVKSQLKNPGVLVAYVLLSNGKVVNEEMIRSGLARVSDEIVTDIKKESKDMAQAIKGTLKEIENEAKQELRGMWKSKK
ncbi:thermonuclease family protein [Brevibacillus reuszeri]|uniref:thermonuclease family protein n=1 Tax=Brevibacillus reuszeri TaxID=54915 RepID=UPI0013E0D81D|nr:thermonuclease family protein [Brevibacillus reuszeri]